MFIIIMRCDHSYFIDKPSTAAAHCSALLVFVKTFLCFACIMHIIAPRAQALNASTKLFLFQTRSYPRHHILPSHLLLEKIAKRFISITVQKMADYYHQQRGTIHLIIGPMFSGKT
jgi:hypothetical protein